MFSALILVQNHHKLLQIKDKRPNGYEMDSLTHTVEPRVPTSNLNVVSTRISAEQRDVCGQDLLVVQEEGSKPK